MKTIIKHRGAVLVVAATLFAQTMSPSAAVPAQSPEQSPEQFVRALYAQYVPGGKPTAFDYPVAKRIVDSEMLAALRRDRDLTPKGDEGAMDSDPVCQCQDWGTLKILSLKIKAVDKDRSSATVVFSDLNDRQTVRLDLVRAKGLWKIHDIGTKSSPSLLTYLRTYKYQ
jgi:uncharacterized protein DUF3828